MEFIYFVIFIPFASYTQFICELYIFSKTTIYNLLANHI